MAATPTELNHDPVFRTIDMGAEAKKIWGPQWAAPELEYEFSNGRKFKRVTGECAVYATSRDHG